MKIKVLTLFIFLTASGFLFSQSNCASAQPFCLNPGFTVAATTSTPPVIAQAGPSYSCLSSQPNPTWLYLQLQNSGNLAAEIKGVIGNAPGGDVDFICWGPFTTLNNVCNNLTLANVTDCSYSGSFTETLNIPNGISGSYYVVLITNFSNVAQNIVISQYSGTASTNCNLYCVMGAISSTVTPNLQLNTYALNGALTFSGSPPGGTLIVTNSCTNQSISINPPFSAPMSFSISQPLPAVTSTCVLTAYFSSVGNCSVSAIYSVSPACSFSFVSAVVNTPTFTSNYALNGVTIFNNAPATGSLIVLDNCSGQSIAFNAPFISPLAYDFPQASSPGGQVCNVNAYFTAAHSCSFNTAYFSPYDVTGYSELDDKVKMRIYPTVFHANETVNIHNWQDYQWFKIYTPDGKLVSCYSIDNACFLMDVSQLTNAVYFVTLEHKINHTKQFFKIVVLK